MKANYKFSNICGTVYQQGNVLFTPDGNTLLSPVGNRVSIFDLVNNKSFTLPFENRKNIAAIALSPDANVLISVDDDGRALLVNFRRGTVLHHFNFKKPVKDIKFSPDGKFIAVTHGTQLQVWRTPNHLAREFAPFDLHRTYTGHHDDVLSIEWAPDSSCFITTSRDMTARLFTLNPLEGFRPKTFAGHRDAVLGAYFSSDGATARSPPLPFCTNLTIFTDIYYSESDSDSDEPIASTSQGTGSNIIANTRWGVHKRHYFNQANTKVVCTTFHAPSNLLIVGFSTGVFGLWEMPAFSNVHTLSISQEKISSVAINASGEWLAFGAKKLGQLLVWEWQSESYILKQQGHFYDMNTLAYAPDGQTIATGGDDGKVKVWSTHSGFCFVTFTEHTAPISSVAFAKHGSVLFSASLDGTVRAYDLVRYRNFRTFTSPSPVQFSALAVDPSGEVVAAGSTDSFEVFMWSVQTGKLLDVLTGHEGPISALDFSPSGANQLASGSWDRTIRVWNVFGRSRAVEPLTISSDVLAVAFRPDGKEIAASSLDGQIAFFDVEKGKQTNVIEGRKDVSGGRKADDRVSAANSTSGKAYNSLAYTADGKCILAGGNSKYVVLYDVREGEGVMVKKFQISQNLSLDGTEEFLDSRKVNDAGINTDLIDSRGDESDLEDRMDLSLPGASRAAGDMSIRRYRQEARTKCVRFSPTGRAWAAASTEGLLIYSLDETVSFDPFDLSIDLTPQAVLDVLGDGEYLKSLVMAFRLNEKPLIRRVYEGIPRGDIRLVARQLPGIYVPLLLRFVADHLAQSPHLEFDLLWANTLLVSHGRQLRDRSAEYASVFRVLQKALVDSEQSISKLCEGNISTMSYLLDQQTVRNHATLQGDVEMPPIAV
ncbi:Small nucleolar ribonucleoprotein complex subunit [Mycena indigotica]|uniref:Small nucleolar ribonucleoprotein complex subunit n=1 Tax=Mycena indigotica TaxID=2126181 RepID=A0A8H6WGY9_9AGAR|nr:Small nucleolar ribonucleoprotein complex subunit [Mycena indigotica]KAF7316426.1 Small nucleolar ribonucleoprotein complex subunit [Mycena indigotica]